ncbi:MAG: hypothetical protein JXR97_00620, partial [Planctomycetes bacterium]|nr:hypothetical protein [Planctomycetota bacterium]
LVVFLFLMKEENEQEKLHTPKSESPSNTLPDKPLSRSEDKPVTLPAPAPVPDTKATPEEKKHREITAANLGKLKLLDKSAITHFEARRKINNGYSDFETSADGTIKIGNDSCVDKKFGPPIGKNFKQRQSFTIELVYSIDKGGKAELLCYRDAEDNEQAFRLEDNNGILTFYFNMLSPSTDDPTPFIIGKNLERGKLHYVTVSFEHCILSAHIDGKSTFRSKVIQGEICTFENSNYALYVGHSGSDKSVKGKVHLLTLYRNAIGEKEIEQAYHLIAE